MKQEDLNRLKEICENEMIKVKADGGNIGLGHFYFIMNESAKDKCRKIGYWKVNEYLAKQLEEYLNA